MNMVFTASCLFMLQCISLIDITVADPLIDVSPSEINPGITSTLDVNCTFSINNHPDMAALPSLVLSRANATGQTFEDLAAITEFSPDSVTLLTQEKVSATGVNSQTGETFLHITWQYPTALQGGVYKCSAHGLDNIGYNVEMTNISSVTLDEANLNDIFEKLRQLEMHEASMQQKILALENDKLSMEQSIQTLQNDKMSMEQRFENLENYTQCLENDKVSMENQMEDLERFVVLLARGQVDLIGSHGAKDYYVSNYRFTDINNAIDVCKLLGGQLAVIDDYDEFAAVNGFLSAVSGMGDVVIAGSDEQTEGNWVLPGTNTSLPFTSWFTGTPRISTNNCLWLGVNYSWDMFDETCHNGSPTRNVRFMCEI